MPLMILQRLYIYNVILQMVEHGLGSARRYRYAKAQASPLPPTPIATLLEGQIVNWRVTLQPGGSNCSTVLRLQPGGACRLQPGVAACSLEAQIAAWGVRLQSGGSDCSLEAQIVGWKLSLHGCA